MPNRFARRDTSHFGSSTPPPGVAPIQVFDGGASGTSALEFKDTNGTLHTVVDGVPGKEPVRFAEISLTDTNMKALRATPIELVAAPGAAYVLELVSATLIFDYTAAYTESADNMAIKYTDGSGVQISDDIEATGFVDATADTITFARKKVDGIVAASGAANKALVLHNTGDGEYGGGNAANRVRVKVSYRVWATGL